MRDITGDWEVTARTPLGPQRFLLAVTVAGDELHGTATHDETTSALVDGQVDDETVRFSVPMEKPMRLTLRFTLTVAGDTLTGRAKAGFLPAFDVTGVRRG